MTYLLFFVAVIASCLLWSAACTAAAARMDRSWLRRLLVAAAVAVPVIALLPWLLATAWLAWGARLENNWFGPLLTTMLAAVVGAIWITRSGLSQRVGLPAAGWPFIGLTVAFLVAKCLVAGAICVLDHEVVSLARFQRVEAAAIMQSVVSPAVSPDDDAAPLYLRAFRSIEAEPHPLLETALRNVDATGEQATALLARHATTLDLLRRAADRGGCHFVHDWTRPSIAMLLPEVPAMRQAGRLLALAIRRDAATGKPMEALRDIARLQRMARHVAGEPILVCGLVGQAIDRTAIECLSDVLPRLTKTDLPALERAVSDDFITEPIFFTRHFLGEEAFVLTTFADVIDPRDRNGDGGLGAIGGEAWSRASGSLLPFFRSFLAPADMAGYRTSIKQWHDLASPLPIRSFPEIAAEAAVLEEDPRGGRRAGILTSMLTPALTGVLKSQTIGLAYHRAADIAVAATRHRLETGSEPKSVAALVPRFLPAPPRDPFTVNEPLILKENADAWLVYSVGPNGKNDGGPVKPGAEEPSGNDDVGLWLAR